MLLELHGADIAERGVQAALIVNIVDEPGKLLGDVIEGWTEGVQLMTVGEKMRFWIPERLAYKGKSEPRGMLVFDVELLAIK